LLEIEHADGVLPRRRYRDHSLQIKRENSFLCQKVQFPGAPSAFKSIGDDVEAKDSVHSLDDTCLVLFTQFDIVIKFHFDLFLRVGGAKRQGILWSVIR
jgi:hypothetical protein